MNRNWDKFIRIEVYHSDSNFLQERRSHSQYKNRSKTFFSFFFNSINPTAQIIIMTFFPPNQFIHFRKMPCISASGLLQNHVLVTARKKTIEVLFTSSGRLCFYSPTPSRYTDGSKNIIIIIIICHSGICFLCGCYKQCLYGRYFRINVEPGYRTR
jgi:hypothetical protein